MRRHPQASPPARGQRGWIQRVEVPTWDEHGQGPRVADDRLERYRGLDSVPFRLCHGLVDAGKNMLEELLTQTAQAAAYYGALIILMRLAGKRLAGQTTTFDLIVPISPGAVLHSAALQAGTWNAIVFVITVFALHRVLALLCARSSLIRHLVRGKPRVLVRDGRIMEQALADEGISQAELLAGLRKLGYDSPETVKLAPLEETGHISAVST